MRWTEVGSLKDHRAQAGTLRQQMLSWRAALVRGGGQSCGHEGIRGDIIIQNRMLSHVLIIREPHSNSPSLWYL